jgi:hypothetical protein
MEPSEIPNAALDIEKQANSRGVSWKNNLFDICENIS